MKILIKNMMTLRCKMIVMSVLEDLGIEYYSLDIGEMELKNDITDDHYAQLKAVLMGYGLELLKDKNVTLIERIKEIVIEMIHNDDDQPPRTKYSYCISSTLHYNYTHLANLFSKITGSTIEHFIIFHKIERAKELILDEELTLKEISYKLNYSSVGHLSSQFKKITGLSPTQYKVLKDERPMAMENVGMMMEL